MINKNIPAISVIIPMYNAEKYIGECLDSILAQTFTDFEVIVVDDCSTDNSYNIVSSYVNQFAGGGYSLKLIQSKVNSGGGGIPRNIGIGISRGKYIFFLDSDDFIIKTALEELYAIAKDFNADVVHCEKFYVIHNNDNITISGLNAGEYVTIPTLISDNFADRVAGLQKVQFVWNLWTKLIRRDFIIENDIKMINTPNCEDMLFTCCLVCSAKNYVRVPNIVNFYRVVDNSISNKKDSVQISVHKYANGLRLAFNYFDEFLNRQDFFNKHLDVKYTALEIIVREFTNYLLNIYSYVPPHQLNEFIRAEFENINAPALTAFLFNRMNVFNINLIQQNRLIQQLQSQLAAQK